MSNENIILPAMSDQMTEAELLTWKVSVGDVVKKGDVITFSPKSHKLIKYFVLKSPFWPLPPKNYQISYKTFQIMDMLLLNFLGIVFVCLSFVAFV